MGYKYNVIRIDEWKNAQGEIQEVEIRFEDGSRVKYTAELIEKKESKAKIIFDETEIEKVQREADETVKKIFG